MMALKKTPAARRTELSRKSVTLLALCGSLARRRNVACATADVDAEEHAVVVQTNLSREGETAHGLRLCGVISGERGPASGDGSIATKLFVDSLQLIAIGFHHGTGIAPHDFLGIESFGEEIGTSLQPDALEESTFSSAIPCRH